MMRHCLFALLLLLLTAPSAWAGSGGGPFYSTLYNSFCTSLPGKQMRGCNGYLQYRIVRGKSRDEAMNKCNWGCGEMTSNPSDLEDCRAGCQASNSQDN